MAEVAPEPIPSSSTGGGLAFPEMGEEVEPEEAAPEEVTPEEVAPEEAAPEEVIPEEEAPEPIPSSISTKETVLSEIAEEVVPEPFPSSSSTDDDTIMSPFMDIYLEPEPPGGTELETLSGKPIPYTKLKQYDVAKFTNLIGERQECKSKHGTVYEFWLTTECPKETVQDRIAKRSDPDYCKEELFLETEEVWEKRGSWKRYAVGFVPVSRFCFACCEFTQQIQNLGENNGPWRKHGEIACLFGCRGRHHKERL